MDKLKTVTAKIFNPNIFFKLALVILSAFMLIYVFTYGDENSVAAYITYLMSAYTMAVVTAGVIRFLIQKRKRLMIRNPYMARYMLDHELRAEISLAASTFANILYAVFRIASGVLYHSVWSGAVGGYYIVLSLIRIILMRDVTDIYIKKQSDSQISRGWHSYRLCGILMFLLNGAMAGMAVQMIWQNKSYSYPGTMIFISAMYTFYSFTTAIVNIVKFRKLNNPVLSAAKALNLAGALMSMFALQTAMLIQFGGDEKLHRMMNTITGASVCIIVMFMAAFMIIRANIRIKRLCR